MHYLVFAVIEKPNGRDVEALVEQTLSPWSNSEWDWYQIGGRWTGHLSGYDPEKDPKNQELCKWCHGTGTRTVPTGDPAWKPEEGRCNGCEQSRAKGLPLGWTIKWTTDWATDIGDVVPLVSAVKAIEADPTKQPYAICDGADWMAREEFRYDAKTDNGEFVPLDVPSLAEIGRNFDDPYVVVVDCHN